MFSAIMYKKRLFTPGPTPVPEDVMLAMARPMIHHRHREFEELFSQANQYLQYLFQTRQDVFTLTSSGTGAMEAAVCNLLSPGDLAMYVNGGKFGERWGEICSAFGVRTIEVAVEWGDSLDPARLRNELRRNPDVKSVFLTHSETSTGALFDIEALARVVRENSKALVVVDGVTSVGAMPMYMDQWGVDVLVTGSQKGLMIPPGLAFIAFSERAWEVGLQSSLPKYYFNLQKAKKTLVTHETPWTPAVTLMIGLKTALEMIQQEGIEAVWKRHAVLASAVRAGCMALGLSLFPKHPTDALTAVRIPSSIEAKTFSSILKDPFGITIAGGQGSLKNKIIRISHLGYYDGLDAVGVISAIEMALEKCGWKFTPGDGVRAVQAELLR